MKAEEINKAAEQALASNYVMEDNRDAFRQGFHIGYEEGHKAACRAQYHDFQQGEKHAAQNIIEMIHNGWHLNAIEALCRQKIEEAEKEAKQ